ncbi:MAG TPA: CAP domain-containing protein [Candidatus Kapabacteria bacterium]|nr:CAP domain-containing protein [Candidatus Kapabacteria bacterium]
MTIHRTRALLPILVVGVLLVVSGCAVGTISPRTTPPPPSPPNPFEQGLLDEVNRYRASRGLATLKLNDVMTAQARLHSMNMSIGSVRFGHDGFKERAGRIRSYISVLEISENLAVNKGYPDPVSVAFRTLMASPGHRRNIEGHFDMTGVGVAKSSDGTIFFTQMFADGQGRFR